MLSCLSEINTHKKSEKDNGSKRHQSSVESGCQVKFIIILYKSPSQSFLSYKVKIMFQYFIT